MVRKRNVQCQICGKNDHNAHICFQLQDLLISAPLDMSRGRDAQDWQGHLGSLNNFGTVMFAWTLPLWPN